MPASVQLNTRLSPKLKKSGDEALASIGLTPTAAVRALWQKAARRGKDLQEVAELLKPETASSDINEIEIVRPITRGWNYMYEAYERLGISTNPAQHLPQDNELLEAEDWDLLHEGEA